ncbi:MAG: hypothetical protein CMJ19_14915 [Phycisphaeraceae bacterium]|nr:hypothetical protein [Phycisphaeraceae bacterium]
MYFCSSIKQCRFSVWDMQNAKFASKHVTDGLSDKNQHQDRFPNPCAALKELRQTPDFAVKIRKYITESQNCLKMIEQLFNLCANGLSKDVRTFSSRLEQFKQLILMSSEILSFPRRRESSGILLTLAGSTGLPPAG